MRRIKRVLLSLSLLSLFVAYEVSITMFTHIHYVNGVMVAHSHPYKDAHSHTKSHLLVIAQIAFFHSLEAHAHDSITPERPVLCTVEIPESISIRMGEHFRIPSLRAPPAVA